MVFWPIPMNGVAFEVQIDSTIEKIAFTEENQVQVRSQGYFQKVSMEDKNTTANTFPDTMKEV